VRRVAPLLAAFAFAALAPLAASAGDGTSARAGSLTVFAAASLSGAFDEIGKRLEAAQGIIVTYSFAGSQQLAAQIEQGAAPDLFASADLRWMDELRQKSLLAPGDTVFCHNQLVVVVPKANHAHIRKLTDLANGGLKLVLAAEAVPVGKYSRQCLQNLSRLPGFGDDYATRVLKNLVSEEENVKSVMSKVQLGEADAGIVYSSDVTPSAAREVRVIEIPASANVIASYPIARLASAAHGAEGVTSEE